MGAIGGFGGNGDGAFRADLHALDMGFKAGDHLPLAQRELQRFTAGSIELSAVGQTSSIIDAHGVAILGLCHGSHPFGSF
ncbi:hypothetical protein AJ88_39200 [Mesorhizobium amorphae CCBAU 01583]|nr:hypothetical protein AJ88_39200 [Mesorhizobium amorphae CCBAU 01583]